jgi:hypothetical protein
MTEDKCQANQDHISTRLYAQIEQFHPSSERELFPSDSFVIETELSEEISQTQVMDTRSEFGI